MPNPKETRFTDIDAEIESIQTDGLYLDANDVIEILRELKEYRIAVDKLADRILELRGL